MTTIQHIHTRYTEYRIVWPNGVTEGPFDSYREAREFAPGWVVMGGAIQHRIVTIASTEWDTVPA